MAILNIKDSLGQWQRVSTLDGVTPHIDQTNKHWFIGTTDTGIVAEGVNGTNGTNGVTPHIDATTKHWMIGTTDTGIVAEGVDGEDGTIINVSGSAVESISFTSDPQAQISALDSTKQNSTDNSLTTTSKQIVGAINEHESDISSLNLNKVDISDYNPEAKTSAMTQSVGKDANGKLWTEPSGGGGGVTSVNGRVGAVVGVQDTPNVDNIVTVGTVASVNKSNYDAQYQQKQNSAVENNFAKFNASGQTVDSGLSAANFMIADADAVYKLVTNSVIAPIILT